MIPLQAALVPDGNGETFAPMDRVSFRDGRRRAAKAAIGVKWPSSEKHFCV
jgi:hypothetical protein